MNITDTMPDTIIPEPRRRRRSYLVQIASPADALRHPDAPTAQVIEADHAGDAALKFRQMHNCPKAELDLTDLGFAY